MKTSRNLHQSLWRIPLCLAAAILLTAQSFGAITAQWDFNSGNLDATIGNPMTYHDGPGGATELATQFGTTTALGIPDIQGTPALVIRVPKNTAPMGFLVQPNMAANGGGNVVNQYSLVFDMLFPTNSVNKSRALLQIDTPTANNTVGELFVGANNGVGAATFQGAIPSNTWRRVVVTVNLASSIPTMRKYIDGTLVGSETLAQGLDMRWALNDKNSFFGADNALLFSDSTPASEVVYVNSIQMHDTVLAQNYILALGAAQASGIPTNPIVPAMIVDRQPAPSSTYVLPSAPIQIQILQGTTPINQGTIQVYFDGVLKTNLVTGDASQLLVTTDPGLLAPSSTHQVELKYVEPTTSLEVSSGVWSFTLAPYNYPPIDLTASMLYVPFDLAAATNGATVPDNSTQTNTGVLNVPALTDLLVDGRVGKAIDFQNDANINYVTLSKNWVSAPNSFAAWIKLPTNLLNTVRGGVMAGSFNAANNINWEFNTLGRPRVYWNAGSPDWNIALDLRTGNWEHLAFVRDTANGQFRFYLNGRPYATNLTLGTTVIPAAASYLGADRRGAATPKFRGALDEMVVFSKALTDEEVWRVYARAFQFPAYGFQVPQIVSVTPAEGSSGGPRLPLITAQIDETNSTTKVDRTLGTYSLTLNGVAQTVSLVTNGNYLEIQAQAVAMLPPSTLCTNVLTFNLTPSGSPAVQKTWTFTTAPAPVITNQPVNRTVFLGAGAYFSVGGQFSPPINYQWRHNGNPITNANASILGIDATSAPDAGNYDVIVSDAGGSVTSAPAVLTLISLPVDPAESLRHALSAHWSFDTNFTSQPAGYTGNPVNGAAIGVDARIGAGSLSLQQASAQWVDVNQRVITNGSQTYAVAGWFKVNGGSDRRFLWESAPNYAISTEIGPAGTLRVFSQLADGSGPTVDTLIAPPSGEWHHVAVSFDSLAGAVSVYYDGQKVNSYNLTRGIAANTTTEFHIGTYRTANTRYFDGNIDDVAVWNRPMSAAEAAYLAAGNPVPPPLPPVGPIVITAEPPDLTLPPHSTAFLSVTATGAIAFEYQWRLGPTDIPGAINQTLRVGDITNSGDYSVVVTDGIRFTTSRVAHVEIQTLPGSPAASLPYGLTANWPFDTDFKASNPTYNGTALNGASITASSKVGAGAVQFQQGLQQYVNVPAPVLLDNTLTYSVAGWFNLQGGTGRRFLWENAPNNYSISTEISAIGTLRVFTIQADSTQFTVDTGITVPLSEWHHVAVTYNGAVGIINVYYDGTLAATLPVTPDIGTFPSPAFNMGTYRTANDRFFEGKLDDVGVWSRVLSEPEIAYLAAGNAISVPPLKITSVSSGPGGVTINWQNGTGPYTVQYVPNLGATNAWIDLAPASMATSITDTNQTTRRFYRVKGQ